MKNKLYFLFFWLACSNLLPVQKAAAQTGSVGIGTTSPDPSSILDVTAANKGVLLPRMTMGQRNAIGSPATGLLIYQTDNNPGFYYYFNGWQPIGSSVATSGANQVLSNLQSTSINTDLLPGSSGTISLGSPSANWMDLYLSGSLYLQGNRSVFAQGTNNFFGGLAGNPGLSGAFNTATGYHSLANISSGFWNTANGFEALVSNNVGYSNTGIGYLALTSNTAGYYNLAVGALSLSNNTTGAENSAVGIAAGGNISDGNRNTFLGANTTGSSGIGLSNSTAIGNQANVTGSNMVRIGNAAVTSIGGQVNWSALSDGRFKRNVRENVPGLAFINQLRAVTYNLDVDGIDKTLNPVSTLEKGMEGSGKKRTPSPDEINARKQKAAIEYTGFIAQEVEAAAQKVGYRFSGVDAPKNANDFYGLRYAEFVVPLVKAVQELNNKQDELVQENKLLKKDKANFEATIKNQQQQIDALKTLILDLQKQVGALKTTGSK